MPLPPVCLSAPLLVGKTEVYPKLLKLISLWRDHLEAFLATVFILGQDPKADVFKFDGGTFGFKAEITFGGFAVRSARNFFAIYPKAHLTVDRSDVVVVPLVDAFGETFSWEAAFAVWSDRWKGLHFSWSGGENITMRGEPVRGFSFIFFPVGLVSKI